MPNRAHLLLPLILLSLAGASAADWPTYRSDSGRTGYSDGTLPDQLVESWKFESQSAPAPAWHTRERAEHDVDQRLRRQFDMVFQPVVAEGLVYFGSSADDHVYALDATTGKVRWTYATDGPVRVAPVFWRGALFVTSDDGFLHCLDAADGKPRWKLHGAPQRGRVMGNGRMISRWPCRGGAVIDREGTIYFSAGVWPSERTYVIAADAASGTVKWRYSNEVADPADREDTQFKFVSQGHLALGGDQLIVPTGRTSSYYFSKRDGKFLRGVQDFLAYGDPVVIDGMVFHRSFRYASTISRDLSSNETGDSTGRQLAAHPDYLFSTNERYSNVQGQTRSKTPRYGERDGAKSAKIRFRSLAEPELKLGRNLSQVQQLVSCKNKVVAADGNRLVVIDIAANTQQVIELDSPAWGLAIAGGRLIASTESGTIYCFGSESAGTAPPEPLNLPTPPDPVGLAAKEIVKKAGRSRGLCIDIAADGGDLALALLVQNRDLRILALEPEPEKVAATRKRFARMGLYGSRIAVHLDSPELRNALKWHGDLVVSGASIRNGSGGTAELEALCSPYIGKGCVGRPGEMAVFGGRPLEGAGNWTHMYADSGNTFNSNDATIKGSLRSRWFADTPIGLPERHGRAQQPAVCDGYMVVPGLDGIHTCNLYNGMPLWSQEIPGMMHEVNDWHAGGTGTGGHMCIGDRKVFARAGNRCLVFDLQTGEKLEEFKTPGAGGIEDGQWGYLAYNNGIVFGSISDPDHKVWGASDKYKTNKLLVESVALFAVDVETGKLLWTHLPEESVRNNTIAVDGRAIYFIDRKKFMSLTEEAGGIINGRLRPLAKKNGTTLSEEIAKFVKRDPGVLLSLEARSGKLLWKTKKDVLGTSLMVSDRYRRVHIGSNGAYGVLGDGGEDGRVLDSATGALVYAGPRRRSGLNGFELDGKDIRTGETIPADRSVSGSFAWNVKGCGLSTSSTHFTMLGNGAMRFIDRSVTPAKMQFWAGVKANCWISSIPAGGVVVNGSSGYGCQCNYHTQQATFVLEPVPGDSPR